MKDQHGWTYPALFKRYLLQYFPSSSTTHATRTGGVKQLHSMRRGPDGSFNQLWAGKPDFHPEFERALEKAVEDMREEGRIQNQVARVNPLASVDGQAVFEAIARLKREHPDLGQILTYFQTPPRLRRFDATLFAHTMGVSKNTLYRMLHYATLAVWLNLPAAEREKLEPAWEDDTDDV